MNAPFFPPDPSEVNEARAAAIRTRAPRVAEIKTLWARRRTWVRSDVRLQLQAQAFCRVACDGDKDKGAKLYAKCLSNPETEAEDAILLTIKPLEDARQPILAAISAIDKALAKLVKGMAGYEFALATRGVGMAWYAGLIAEASGDMEEDGTPRDIASYQNPGKLWKRMGLSPYKGKACSTWRKAGGLHAAEWEELGYAPRRRSVMWNIGKGLIGGMGRGFRPEVGQSLDDLQALRAVPGSNSGDKIGRNLSYYERLFVERCRYEVARDPEMRREPTKEGKESYSKTAQARAKRYVEKRFLRELWKVWRYADLNVIPVAAPKIPASPKKRGRPALAK